MADIIDLAWIIITQLGEEWFYLAVLVAVYLGINRKLGVKVATYAMTSVWLNSVLKDLFMIPRPPAANWKIHAEGYGFPSGHAQGSTVLFGYLANKIGNYVAYAAAAGLVFLISCSRVALGVHSVYDVIGGVFFGLTILTLGWLVEHKLAPRLLRDQAKLAWLSLPIAFAMVGSLAGLGGDDPFRAAGALFGLLIGYMILEIKETREPTTMLERAVNMIAGLAVAVTLYYTVGKAVTGPLPVFLALAATGLAASLVPLVTTRFTGPRQNKRTLPTPP
jgi:membrane-associated phospholipid phosphatase